MEYEDSFQGSKATPYTVNLGESSYVCYGGSGDTIRCDQGGGKVDLLLPVG